MIQYCLMLGLALSILTSCPQKTPDTSSNKPLFRIAKLTIDSTQLDAYKIFLAEEIEASVSKEPGVLTLYAVYEKENPTRVTLFEFYADEKAYQSHLLTTHFLKYKNGTKNMVRSLELAEAEPINLWAKKQIDFINYK